MKHFLQDSWLLDDMMFIFLSHHHPQSPHLPLVIPFQIVSTAPSREGGGRTGDRGREEREVEEGGQREVEERRGDGYVLDLGRLFTVGLRGHRSELWSSEWHVLHHDSVPFACPVKHCAKRLGFIWDHTFIS